MHHHDIKSKGPLPIANITILTLDSSQPRIKNMNDVNNNDSVRILFSEIEQINNNYDASIKSLSGARDMIFQLGSIVGQMCSIFLTVPHDSKECTQRPSLSDDPFWLEESKEKDDVATQLGKVFIQLFTTASVCGIDLCTSILKKVELNGRKYPVELCKVCFHDELVFHVNCLLSWYMWYLFVLVSTLHLLLTILICINIIRGRVESIQITQHTQVSLQRKDNQQ